MLPFWDVGMRGCISTATAYGTMRYLLILFGSCACRRFVGGRKIVLPSAVVEIALSVHTADTPLLAIGIIGSYAHDCRPLIFGIELVPGTHGCYAVTL